MYSPHGRLYLLLPTHQRSELSRVKYDLTTIEAMVMSWIKTYYNAFVRVCEPDSLAHVWVCEE